MSNAATRRPTFLELNNNDTYKKAIIDSLCGGLGDEDQVNRFRNMITYVISSKTKLFDIQELKGSLYEGDDDVLDLVLPSIRRVYGKVFTEPPTLLKDKRLELFQEYFDIDEFIDYMIDMMLKTKDCLKEFKNLDRTVDTLTLIVDNYVAGLVEKSKDVDNHIQIIRDLKLNKLGK